MTISIFAAAAPFSPMSCHIYLRWTWQGLDFLVYIKYISRYICIHIKCAFPPSPKYAAPSYLVGRSNHLSSALVQFKCRLWPLFPHLTCLALALPSQAVFSMACLFLPATFCCCCWCHSSIDGWNAVFTFLHIMWHIWWSKRVRFCQTSPAIHFKVGRVLLERTKKKSLAS